MREANLALRFALELAAIAALVAFGLSLDASVVVRAAGSAVLAAIFAALVIINEVLLETFDQREL